MLISRWAVIPLIILLKEKRNKYDMFEAICDCYVSVEVQTYKNVALS
jgi:hypothetical protein